MTYTDVINVCVCRVVLCSSGPLQTCSSLLPVSTWLVRYVAQMLKPLQRSLLLHANGQESQHSSLCPLVHHVVTDNPYPPPNSPGDAATLPTAIHTPLH